VGQDGKYGQVITERGQIPPSEPVVLFRARDALLGDVLAYYGRLCTEQGSPAHHLQRIDDTLAEVRAWQATHQTKLPTSDMLDPAREPTQAPALIDRLVIYRDSEGDWRWHRVAGNGELIGGSGEGYRNLSHCQNIAVRVNRLPYLLELHTDSEDAS